MNDDAFARRWCGGRSPAEEATRLGVDWIDVRWPSGRKQRLAEPPVNTTIRIVEGEEGFEEVYGRSQG